MKQNIQSHNIFRHKDKVLYAALITALEIHIKFKILIRGAIFIEPEALSTHGMLRTYNIQFDTDILPIKDTSAYSTQED